MLIRYRRSQSNFSFAQRVISTKGVCSLQHGIYRHHEQPGLIMLHLATEPLRILCSYSPIYSHEDTELP